jgi:hypothetical protein
VRRVRTNTPLQALTMLNDEAFFEAARALAGRITREGGTTVREHAAYGFRLVTSRAPTSAETDRIAASYEQQLSHFRAHRQAAERVVSAAARVPDGAKPSAPATERGAGPTASATRARATNASVESAAWTMVANALLNLDEAVNK